MFAARKRADDHDLSGLTLLSRELHVSRARGRRAACGVHLKRTKVTRMNRRSAILLALGAVTATLTPAGDARAEGSNSRKVERYEVAGNGARAGAARTVVEAPREVVRSVVTDYNRYTDFITRFRSAKIVGKSGDKTDVYLQVPIMNGTVKIWAVVRFDPPKQVGNDLVITSKMLK